MADGLRECLAQTDSCKYFVYENNITFMAQESARDRLCVEECPLYHLTSGECVSECTGFVETDRLCAFTCESNAFLTDSQHAGL